MSELYPPESQNLDIIGHLEELRRRILVCLAVWLVLAVALFCGAETLMQVIKRPLSGSAAQLIFLTPTEVFVSYVRVSLLAAFVAGFPVLLWQAFAFLSPAVERSLRRNVAIWVSAALLFFVFGIVFSYTVAVPAALKFLLEFGKGVAVPQLSLAKYVSFVSAFILIGGVIFEIPIVIGLLADVGLIKPDILRAKRKYALLIILVLAAVLTPTHDVVNLMVFAVPMALLYEAGILFAVVIGKRKDETRETSG